MNSTRRNATKVPHLTTSSAAIAFLMTALAATGCGQEPTRSDQAKAAPQKSQPAPAVAIAVPVEGTWQVAERLVPGIFYNIALKGRQGTITVEVDGQVVRSHPFTLVDERSIKLTGHDRGPYRGESFSGAEISDILELKDPPGSLTFSRECLLEGQDVSQEGTIYLRGLIATLPIPIPMRRVKQDERIQLPFQVNLDWDVSFSGVVAFTEDGPWGSTPMHLKSPSHPEGRVNSLQIGRHDVALNSHELQDGLLETRDFGQFEFVLLGSSSRQAEVRVTLAQLRRIRAWLDARDSSAPTEPSSGRNAP